MKEKIYYLVKYDDGYNYGRCYNCNIKNELLSFLNDNHFSCQKGYWSCPWYFIDIKNKIYYPGRPGVSYGKVFGDRAISFEEFLTIYQNEKNCE